MVTKDKRLPIKREDRARMVYEFCQRIAAGQDSVYLPSYAYVGNDFGWSYDVARTAVQDLIVSGALLPLGQKLYGVLAWDGTYRRSA